MKSNGIFNSMYEFHCLNNLERVKYIGAKIKKLGLFYQVQTFNSAFGEGKNIVSILNSSNRIDFIISAHYDGKYLFDNTGGVFALLEIMKVVNKLSSQKNFCFLFSDQEEKFQQGVVYFMKKFNLSSNVCNINIDGFGIGDEIYQLNDENYNTTNNIFKTDSHKFQQIGIKSSTYCSIFKIDYGLSLTDLSDKYLDNELFKKSFSKYEFIKNIDKLITHL